MEGLQAASASQAWIAQKYLEAPLLFQGRKFDVRIFALLESSPQTELGFALYAYREGYGRTSSEIFTLDELHPTMHLTNFAVQKSAEATFGLHEAGNSISFPDIERALGSSVGFLARIVPAMHGLMADAVLAARAQLMDTLAAAGAPKAHLSHVARVRSHHRSERDAPAHGDQPLPRSDPSERLAWPLPAPPPRRLREQVRRVAPDIERRTHKGQHAAVV